MKKQLLLFIMMMLPVVASADAVEIDRIWYNLDAKVKQAQVTSNQNGKYKNSVVIPASVTYEGIQYTVTSIANSAFYNTNTLKSVSIPNSVKTIGDYAFSGCSSLTSATIGNSVKSIGQYAFNVCTGLTSISIPNSVETIGKYAFYGCSGLTSVTIGNSVTSIGSFAFSQCSGLTSVTIPNSVTSIGGSAFRGCSGLVSIVIGSGVTQISFHAFDFCSCVEDVYCLAESVPSTSGDAFLSIGDATLHVPVTSLNAYKAKEPWSSFKDIVAIYGEKCARPTISYSQGILTFNSDTEGVSFCSSITDTDIKDYNTASIQLGVTYNISVYATKPGYDNSETATATLCWLNVEPEKTGITDTPTSVPERVLMLKTDDGTTTYYDINGRRLPAPQKGINIIRTKDGNTKKVVVK